MNVQTDRLETAIRELTAIMEDSQGTLKLKEIIRSLNFELDMAGSMAGYCSAYGGTNETNKT